jgi:hypothetical protein
MEEWDKFLLIKDRVPELRKREETRKAVERLLELVAEAANYIRNHMQTRIFGLYSTPLESAYPADQGEDGLVRDAYAKTVKDFKQKFAQAIIAFHESLEIEMFKGVLQLQLEAGELHRMPSLRFANPQQLFRTWDNASHAGTSSERALSIRRRVHVLGGH